MPAPSKSPEFPNSQSAVITAVRVVRLSRILTREEQWYSSDWRAIKADRALVEITTSGGVTALGELSSAAPLFGVERCVDWIAQRILGSPLNDAFQFARPTGSSRMWDAAAAGVDSALWDARAQVDEHPLNECWNQASLNRVETVADAGCCLDWAVTTETVLEEAAACAAYPFGSYAIRLGTAWEWDHVRPDRFLALVWELRSELGGTALIVDADERLSVQDAHELANELSEIGCVTMRRPFPISDLDAYRELAASAVLPVTAGGTLTTYERLLPFLEEGLLGGIEFEIGLCGISEAARRCRLAADYALPVHAVGDLGAVGAFSSAAVLAGNCEDGRLYLPYSHGVLAGGILDQTITLRESVFEFTRSPGTGIELTAELEATFPWIEGAASVSVNRELP